MGWSPKCYIHVPSFLEIGPRVPEKKIFEGFTHNIGMAILDVIDMHANTFVPSVQGGFT